MLAAPKLWNDLPRDLRLVDNISSFKKQLKTHLFKLAYSLQPHYVLFIIIIIYFLIIHIEIIIII